MKKELSLNEKQLKALDRLEELAAREFDKRFKGKHADFHTIEYQKLAAVPGLVRQVKESHDNPHAGSSVEGALVTLREIVKMFDFDLKEKK